jgi:hypothetical protein
MLSTDAGSNIPLTTVVNLPRIDFWYLQNLGVSTPLLYLWGASNACLVRAFLVQLQRLQKQEVVLRELETYHHPT